jgi:hypothetical protein
MLTYVQIVKDQGFSQTITTHSNKGCCRVEKVRVSAAAEATFTNSTLADYISPLAEKLRQMSRSNPLIQLLKTLRVPVLSRVATWCAIAQRRDPTWGATRKGPSHRCNRHDPRKEPWWLAVRWCSLWHLPPNPGEESVRWYWSYYCCYPKVAS